MNTIELETVAAGYRRRPGYRDRPGDYFGVRTMNRSAAATLGYVPVTMEIDVVREEAVARSMAATMQGVDAVWIEHGPVAGKRVTLARKRGEVMAVPEEEEGEE